jgi:hypothetical protein
VRAPAWLVDRFIEHYAAAGASEIFLFFDDPTMADHRPHPRVHRILCDEAHWQGDRPLNIERRQRINHRIARGRNSSPWLLHVDVDEFLLSEGSVGHVLAGVPSDVFSVQAPVREAVYDSLPTQETLLATPYFKNPAKGESRLVERVFGPELAVYAEGGLWGHVAGKSFLRKGRRIGRYSLHRPIPADPALTANHDTGKLSLLHFEALTFEMFREKVVRRSDGTSPAIRLSAREEARRAHMWNVYSRQGDDGLLELYKRFHVLERKELQDCMSAGFVQVHDVPRLRRQAD